MFEEQMDFPYNNLEEFCNFTNPKSENYFPTLLSLWISKNVYPDWTIVIFGNWEQLSVVQKHFFGQHNLIECSWIKLFKINTKINESSNPNNHEQFLVMKSKSVKVNSIYKLHLREKYGITFSDQVFRKPQEASGKTMDSVKCLDVSHSGSNLFFVNQFSKVKVNNLVLNVFEKPLQLYQVLIDSFFYSQTENVRTIEEWEFRSGNGLLHCLTITPSINYIGFDLNESMFKHAIDIIKQEELEEEKNVEQKQQSIEKKKR